MGKNKKTHTLPTPRAITLAFKEMQKFPDIENICEPVQSGDVWIIVTKFSVPLPTRAIKTGISSTGVKDCETVYFRFPASYPRKAPRIFLRRDFPRNLPHINPGSENDFVAPCVYEGSLDDLLHQGEGLIGILYQVQDWLRKAASNSLINSNQGWEAIRYDTFDNIIIYQHAKLRALVTDIAGSKFLHIPVNPTKETDVKATAVPL